MVDFKEKKLLPTITTTSGSDWRVKIKEIQELGIKEIALFFTCLNKNERKELFQLLKKTSVESIPLVHIRNDMTLQELDFLVKNYDTQVFNTHSQFEFPIIYNYLKYKKNIFIENVYHPLDEKEIKNFGGICLDFSHLENDRILNKKKFEHDLKIIEKFPIGANHISVMKKFTHIDEADEVRYDDHYLEDYSELDYLKKYPAKYFSPFIAIELRDSIKEQLLAKDYIINLLK